MSLYDIPINMFVPCFIVPNIFLAFLLFTSTFSCQSSFDGNRVVQFDQMFTFRLVSITIFCICMIKF